MKTVTLNVFEAGEWNTKVNKLFGFYGTNQYSVEYAEELEDGGEFLAYDVQQVPEIAVWDLNKLQELNENPKAYYTTHSILRDWVSRGFLEPGNYLIKMDG